MQISFAIFIALQGLLVAAEPALTNTEIMKEELAGHDLLKLEGRDLEPRACSYKNCDDCLGRFGYCIQCNTGNSLSGCVNCWFFCGTKCGC